MVREEIYLLTKHGGFSAEYIENIPVHDRRYYLSLLKKEADFIKSEQEKITKKVNIVSGRGKRFR